MKQENQRHYHQAISLSFEEKDMLKDLCIKTSLNSSEVVRELIRKAFGDKKTQWIIQQQYVQRHTNEKSLRIMSNESTENKEPPHHSDDSAAVSNSDLLEFSTETSKNQDFQRKLDLQKNAQKFVNLTFEILSTEQLEAVAHENWNFWTIGELMKIADENIRRQKR